MGAAKDDATCATTVVGQIAMFVATLGTGSSANAAAAQAAGRLVKLKAQHQQMKAGWEAIRNIPEVKLGLDFAKHTNRIRQGFNGSATLATAVAEEDMVRAAAQLAASLDPSGVASAVGSYTHPKCSRYSVR